MKRIILLLILSISGTLISCELTNFEFQENPNKLTPESVSPDYLLNDIQILFVRIMEDMAANSSKIMRYEGMMETYASNADNSALNSEWRNLYKLGISANKLESLAEKSNKLNFHRGISHLLKAYCFTTMVDFVGDIPLSEAFDPIGYPNPNVDSGAFIYNDALTEIDLAILDFKSDTPAPLNDLFYNGDREKWIKFANTLKLRLHVNKRLINASESKNAINDLLTVDNIIDSNSDDFQFSYSTSADPESRSPYFVKQYLNEGANDYLGNYFLWLLKDSKETRDPRLRYYIYRQALQSPGDLGFLRCSMDNLSPEGDYDFCYVGDFYWGRDHGDDEGIPPDGFYRSVFGIYPAGGSFDANNDMRASSSPNLGGAGILPLLLSSYANFLKAEAALTLETTGDPEMFLERGIRKSMQKVINFATVDSEFSSKSSDIDAYVAEVMDEYNSSSSKEEKLNIVVREYYLASFGNAIEAYNAYRRTGYPSNIQEPIINENIPFPRSFPYPEDAINTNLSLEVKPITVKVFWDNNPDGFVK